MLHVAGHCRLKSGLHVRGQIREKSSARFFTDFEGSKSASKYSYIEIRYKTTIIITLYFEFITNEEELGQELVLGGSNEMDAFVRRCANLVLLIFISNDGMVLSPDRQYDAIFPDLAPKRIRNDAEVLQLPLHGDELVDEPGGWVERLLGLLVHRIGDDVDVTHVEGHLLGPDRLAEEPADDVEENMLLKIFDAIDLEVLLMVHYDGQDSGEYVFSPLFSRGEVDAQQFDDAIGILGDGKGLILVRGSLVVQDDVGAIGDDPGLGVLEFVDEDEADHNDELISSQILRQASRRTRH